MSNIKKRHLSKYEFFNEKENFKRFFENVLCVNIIRCYSYYYVDDNGNIAKSIYKKNKSKDINLFDNETSIYKIKSNLKQSYKDKLYKSIGKVAFDEMSENYVSYEYYHKHSYYVGRIINEINEEEHRQYVYYKLNYLDFFDVLYIYENLIVLKYGTSEYYRYVTEKADARHKERREYKKHMEEVYADMLYWAEYRKHQNEKKENDAKLIKHGFDPKTSFRNVPLND